MIYTYHQKLSFLDTSGQVLITHNSYSKQTHMFQLWPSNTHFSFIYSTRFMLKAGRRQVTHFTVQLCCTWQNRAQWLPRWSECSGKGKESLPACAKTRTLPMTSYSTEFKRECFIKFDRLLILIFQKYNNLTACITRQKVRNEFPWPSYETQEHANLAVVCTCLCCHIWREAAYELVDERMESDASSCIHTSSNTKPTTWM
jgi:hypothetical protein